MTMTEQVIRASTDLLVFRVPHQKGREFVDLTPSLPDSHVALHAHDIASDTPPENLSVEQYLQMRVQYQVMNAAISEHDQIVIDENIERFREDFWHSFGEGPQGAEIMRRRYRRKLADRLVRILNSEGEVGVVCLSDSKRSVESVVESVTANR